jgi:homoserine dehydrogenase
MTDIGIGIAGLGTVGGGVVKLLRDKGTFFQDGLQLPVRLVRAADTNPARFSNVGLDPSVARSADAKDILDDPSVSVVVELIGGTSYAREFVLGALCRGKHVVTANKALLAEHGPEIFGAATSNGVSVYFEAAVGGGMPVIKTLREAMIANDILSLRTIINGTCNYILTRMAEEKLPFDVALAEAQERGYAEADPTLDIGGFDTGHKLAIMASLAHGGYLCYRDIPIEGISRVTKEDIEYARELGYTVKLLGIIKAAGDGRLDVRVQPTMVHADHILASVGGVFNAVLLEGDAVGSILLYGRGAGETPTASAVCADLIDCARDIASGAPQRIAMGFYSHSRTIEFLPLDNVRSRYYLRFGLADRPGALAGVTRSFADHRISIAAMVQKEHTSPDAVPVIMLCAKGMSVPHSRTSSSSMSSEPRHR